MSHQAEKDGMGFAGLVPTAEERRREAYEQIRNALARAREEQLAKAAAEIERLRVKDRRYREWQQEIQIGIDWLKAENERLRAALAAETERCAQIADALAAPPLGPKTPAQAVRMSAGEFIAKMIRRTGERPVAAAGADEQEVKSQ